jgi:hypothetical protein
LLLLNKETKNTCVMASILVHRRTMAFYLPDEEAEQPGSPDTNITHASEHIEISRCGRER